MTKPNLFDEPAAPSQTPASPIPFPYPDVGEASAPAPANIPSVNQDPLSSTSVPVPETTTQGSTVPAPSATGDLGVTAPETVQGQLTDLFSNKDMNPLFDHARGNAQQYSNSRGLVNSSIAAEAGEQAVFANAMPIASQDANTFAARGQQAAAHVQRLTEMATSGDINSRLQLEQFGYNFQLSEQQNLHNMQLAALQGDIQAELALQNFGFDTELMKQDFGYRVKLADVELRNALELSQQDNEQWLQRIAVDHSNALEQIGANAAANSGLNNENFARDLQGNYLGAVERRTSQFSSEVTSIYQTQGLSAAQQAAAVDVARRNYQDDLALLQDFYSKSPYWDPSFGNSVPNGGPAVPTRNPDYGPVQQGSAGGGLFD